MDLGIVPPEKRKSVRQCLAAGQWTVNGPVYAIMALGYGAISLPLVLYGMPVLADISSAARSSLVFAVVIVLCTMIAIVLPSGLAWIWWSFKVSRWRIWALQNVDDWRKLERLAVLSLLIWPRGSIFEKTEIKTNEQRALEAELLRARDRDG